MYVQTRIYEGDSIVVDAWLQRINSKIKKEKVVIPLICSLFQSGYGYRRNIHKYI